MSNNELTIINENTIKDKIYVIRGIPVMLDKDLALIYGYDVKYLNRQVQRNITKFPEDMMFHLTYKEALSCSWCQNGTLNKSNDRRGFNLKYLPNAFTEQGIYMLMTVLKGELATKQSIELVRLFKKMKDFILSNKDLLTSEEANKLLIRHDNEINDIKSNMVTKDDIKDLNGKVDLIQHNFLIDNVTIPFIISNGHKYEMDKYFKSLFKEVNKSIIIIDNYISTKTLDLLTYLNSSIGINLYSSSTTKSKDKLKEIEFNDFKIDNPSININIYDNKNIIHDRFIIFDYKTNNQRIFTLGQSIKDTGNKISVITELNDINLSKELIDIIDSKSKYVWR